MKKGMFFFGALIAAGLSFTACSSDKDVVESNNSTGNNGGDNYIALRINLPQDPSGSTRAGATDNAGDVTYDDGLATEYAVKNATLIVFSKATKEDDATFVAAYKISTAPWTGGASNNVTEYSTKVIQQVSSDVVAGYKALVVLNHNDILEVIEASDGLSVNGTALTTNTKFSDFRKMLVTSSMTSAGFFMANAPLSTGSGSTTSLNSGATSTLVTISANAIYDSEVAAEAGTNFDQIYVERGMAKVTMQQSGGTTTMTASKIATTTPTALKWQVTGWMLDNTAPSTYLVRSTDGDSEFRSLKSNKAGSVYRYIGNTQINDGTDAASGHYRTYFAKSVGFDNWAASQTYELDTYATGAFYNTFGTASPKYCFENTFDVDHQNIKNTTLVQVAITAKSGDTAEDLYTLGGQKSVVYTKDILASKIKEVAYYVLQGDGVSGTYTTNDITVTIPTTSVAGTVTISPTISGAITVTPDNGKVGTEYNEATFYTNLNAALGAVACYKGGVSYYNIRIKHFGDNLTPWNDGEGTTAPNSSDIYPDNGGNRDNNYLGRYGVLRNNWYDISVNSVRSLGDATPHTGNWPDTPDDELDNYLSFRINVLSWAKRTQSADL